MAICAYRVCDAHRRAGNESISKVSCKRAASQDG